MIIAGLEGVTKRFADKTVLDGVTVGIGERDRVGVIGLNGSGKSTLLRLLGGLEEPEAGRAVLADGVQVRYLPQQPEIDPWRTPLETVLAQPASFDPLDDRADVQREQRARAMLDRLAVAAVDEPAGQRSGGECKRIALAAVLADPGDLLILDEPTNHLDVDVIEWLEDELIATGSGGGPAALPTGPRALLLVTHDRYLLDTLSTRIFEVEGGRVHTHHGSYADYLEEREARRERALAEDRKRANVARTELAWLRRNPKARTTKAKARVGRATAVVDAAPQRVDPELRLELPARRLGGKVVHLHNAGVRYGDRWVLQGIDLKLKPRDRIGVVGPNGSGKTTLLRLLGGLQEPDQGSVRIGATVHVGLYGQEPEALPAGTRLLDAVTEVVREAELTSGVRVTAGQLLERFLFPPAQQKAYVEELSGGERRRLELLRTLGQAPNLLLLDEPTNDLDLDTLSVLEAELDVWPGAVVVASHDRFFLDRVCEHLYAIEPPERSGDRAGGRVRHHPGGWSAYRQRQQALQAQARRERQRRGAGSGANGGAAQRPRKRSYHEQREYERLHARIPELEERKATLAEQLQRVGDDYGQAAALSEELDAVNRALDAAETRWLELAEIGGD